MSNEITTTTTTSLSQEQVELLKRTIAKGASDDELALFIATANRLGLDPFSKQIHAVKRRNKKTKKDDMTIQVGIDGFRAVADRTGETDGQDGPFWCGLDGVWVDVWLSPEAPSAAKVIVYKRGRARGWTGTATMAEYLQTTKDWDTGESKPAGLWAKMPTVMIAKCAEALALRKAFPMQLAGVYTPEEMSQADSIDTAPTEAAETKVEAPAQTEKKKPRERLTGTSEASISHTIAVQLAMTQAELDAALDKTRPFYKAMSGAEKLAFKEALDAAKIRIAPPPIDTTGEAVEEDEARQINDAENDNYDDRVGSGAAGDN